MNKWLNVVINIVIFVVCMVLICTQQRNVGPSGLGIMVVGLAGILFLLYRYNKQYTKLMPDMAGTGWTVRRRI